MNPKPIGVEINIFASLREAPEHAKVEWCEIKLHTFVLVYCKICRNFASQNRLERTSPTGREDYITPAIRLPRQREVMRTALLSLAHSNTPK